MGKIWFDIHNHILPSVDDGAKDWDESKKMLQIAYDEGIRYMIVTPHYSIRRWCAPYDELKEQLTILQKLAYEIDKSFKISLGNELYYQQDAPELLQNRTVQTMAGSDYVLVEFSPVQDFRYIQNALYQLLMEGYFPILAHIERYDCFMKNFKYVVNLTRMGIYVQVNASSVVGENGFSTKRFVRKCLEEDLVHFIGTDAHGAKKRPPFIRKCAKYLKRKYGDERVENLLYHHPMNIIKNQPI